MKRLMKRAAACRKRAEGLCMEISKPEGERVFCMEISKPEGERAFCMMINNK